MIVDAFAGPGGWDRGAASLGLRPVGIEWGEAECRTRAAAGHLTIRADVATWPAETLRERLAGFIISSPCPDFSAAGKRAGLSGETGPLVYEVMRWANEARPRWIAAENVKEVAPIFRTFRAPLAALGYSVWSGVLDVADYGVPQNRRRAILLASLDRAVAPPAPTHSKSGHREMFGAGRLRWVSMAEALSWGYADSQWRLRTSNYTGPEDDRRYYERSIDEPAPTVVPNAGRDNWKLRHPGRTYGVTTTTTTTEPAPTVALGHNMAEWCWERPATTVQGTPRIARPGHTGGSPDKQWQYHNAIAVEMWELGVLQGFPADYPWQGNKTEQARQIGNAVPPPFAAALVAAVSGRAVREAAA